MKNVIPFLKLLKAYNSRDWFNENREKFELARNEFFAFVESLIYDLQKIDNRLSGLEAKNCVFRLNRDVRFSKNKSPYKINFAAILREGGKKSDLPGYYIHIEPGNCFLAAGIYQPDAKILAKIRQEIDYNFHDFLSIIEERKLKKYFGGLVKEDSVFYCPRGYKKDNPAIAYISLRHFMLIYHFEQQILTEKKLSKFFADKLGLCKKFNEFLLNSF